MDVEEYRLKLYFDERAQQFGHSVASVQWRDDERQYIRFDQFFSFLSLDSFALLDVGCGKGDFYDYLLSKHFVCSYSGIDLSAFMIELAKKAYPEGIFEQGDLLGMVGEGVFDYVGASGVFNMVVDDMYVYLHKRVLKMVSLASHGVIFNLLSDQTPVELQQAYLFNYYAKDLVIQMCELFGKVSVLEGYLENDLTISIQL